MGLTVSIEERPNVTVLTCVGELDIYTVAAFREYLKANALDPARKHVILDIDSVTLLDSSGMGALMSMENEARAGNRRLGIICNERRLQRCFEITGLRRAFEFGSDVETVLGAISGDLPLGRSLVNWADWGNEAS